MILYMYPCMYPCCMYLRSVRLVLVQARQDEVVEVGIVLGVVGEGVVPERVLVVPDDG